MAHAALVQCHACGSSVMPAACSSAIRPCPRAARCGVAGAILCCIAMFRTV